MLTHILERHRTHRLHRYISYYPHLTLMERRAILSQRQYHRRLLYEHRRYGVRGFDYESVCKYNTTGYCANNLSASVRFSVRESMRLYRVTGDVQYFVRRFHKDIVTDDLRSDMIEYYSSRRDMTLKQISAVLSEKHGIRVPTYQISRIARSSLPEMLWRRRKKK
jgi:hypothetical protein